MFQKKFLMYCLYFTIFFFSDKCIHWK